MKKLTFIIAFLIVLGSLNAQQILIKNANVFDGKNEQLHEGVDVLVEENLIKQVTKGIKAPKGAEVIDANGKTLIPGLIDVHWHSYYAYAPQSVLAVGDMSEVAIHGFIGAERTLLRGFTTVRDVGGNPYAVKKFTDSGDHPGPRLYISGPPISQTSGHFDFRGKNDVPRNITDPMTYWERNSLIMVLVKIYVQVPHNLKLLVVAGFHLLMMRWMFKNTHLKK